MSWAIGDHGFEMCVSPELPEVLRRVLAPWLSDWLKRLGWSLTDICSWAVHPGGPKILEAVTESLQLPRKALSASWEVLAQYGNMSSPTVLFVLDHLRQAHAKPPCVALAFGPGITLEAALFI